MEMLHLTQLSGSPFNSACLVGHAASPNVDIVRLFRQAINTTSCQRQRSRS